MPQPFTAASHHDVLALLIQVTILLVSARILGEIAQRMGQPSIVGEILAGVLLGPSFLSSVFPALGEWIVPHNEVQGYLLEIFSLLGVMFLLLLTGLETDLALIRRQARTAVGVSLGGLTLMFSAAFVVGNLLPDDLLIDPSRRLVFALFFATALSISAIPVIAKVLMDLKLMRRDIGQTIIAAAMIDDSIGWVMLSVVIGLASGATISAATVLVSIAEVLGFVIIGLTAGRWLIGKVTLRVQNEMISRDKMLTLVVVFMLLGGVATQALGLEALLGAFVVGIIFAQISSLSIEVIHKLESITFGIFSPIFFAVAGLKINIGALLEPRLILLTLIVIGIATVFKVAGVYLGSRLIGKRDHWSALFFGFGLNTRGSMGIIIANIGLELGLLTQEMFSVLVVMAVFTSLVAPTALRLINQQIQVSQDERKRLEHEAMLRDNIVANVRRVLLPVRTRPDTSPIHTIEARLLEKLGNGSNLAVTLLNVAEKGNEAQAHEYLNRLSSLFAQYTLTRKVVVGENPADVILDEVNRGYDLLVLGAPMRTQDTRVLFNPITDYLVRLAPCPSMIVHAPDVNPDWQPRKILVPTNGSLAAKRAAEIAFAIAANDPETQVTVVKVVGTNQSPFAIDNYRMVEQQVDISQQIVNELQTIGESFGVATSSQVEVANKPANMIVEVALTEESDLIVLGVAARAGSERLYLGPMVEYVLDNAKCPVLVVNAG